MKHIHNILYAKRYTLYAILVALFCIALPQAAQAATYYLDANNGNDIIGDGSSAKPWQTMARAMTNWAGTGTRVAFGDTVYLRSGNYGDINFTFTPPSPAPAGWSDAITYKAETGELPVFSYLCCGYYEAPRYLIFDGISVIRPTEELVNLHAVVYIHTASAIKLKNMIITGHWDTVAHGRLTCYGVQADTVAITESHSDILIENCIITNVGQGIATMTGDTGSDVIIRNNTIYHTSNSAIIIGGHTRVPGSNAILIEGNYIYGRESLVEWYTISHDNSITGTFVDQERVTQDITGALGKIFNVNSSVVHIIPLTDDWEIESGYTIRADRDPTNVYLSGPYAITQTEYTHASGIGLRTDNVIIRGNTVRQCGVVGEYHTYPGYVTLAKDGHDGYNNMVIENNLGYDGGESKPGYFQDMGNNCIVRNNTFIGFCYNPPNEDAYRYRGAFRWEQRTEATGTKFYNNLIVGIASMVCVDYPSAVYTEISDANLTEDYNIWYAVSKLTSPYYLTSPRGLHSQILAYGSSVHPATFDSGYFVDPNFSLNHDQVCNYQLLSGASAINFGDPNNAPTTDILGDIRDSQPDAGCYEYGATAFLYGDLSGEGEVTAYDAALTAQAAVELITLTPEQARAADVSGEGEVTAYDAALIAQKAVKLIDKFPVE